MNQEFIFVQTDPAFNIVLQCLTELRDQDRLQVTHFQMAELRDIESNDDNEDRKFMFGGDHLTSNHAFGRTASGIVRMCMQPVSHEIYGHSWVSTLIGETRRSYTIRLDKRHEVFVLQIPRA